ncbi:MAG: ribonuclease J [Wolinella succinogenes]|uniref:ribonuclease J n=1 Tax=Wolinella succinogenes TaxID=844 RepID=UPI00168F5087|nr:ribonuclease J [Wolinella succinogenes]NLU34411.1 ribonuclease J [Wolinella succinogenes]
MEEKNRSSNPEREEPREPRREEGAGAPGEPRKEGQEQRSRPRRRGGRNRSRTPRPDQANGERPSGENPQPEGQEGNGERRDRGERNHSQNQGANAGFYKDLKRGVEVNDRIQKSRLNPHHKLDLQTKAKVRITPLGGLGEIGGNITVIETENSAIVVDVGMSFPDDEMHGVDILVPDFSYLEAIKHKIAGVVITHAHEDHIGAVPYLYKQMQFPLYGTPLPLGMIGSKFDEHGLKRFRSLFRVVEKRKPIKIGDFEVEWIHMTHSIIDASSLAIKTEAGTIIHTGDFKIDHTPIDGFAADLHRLAHYGEEGVMLMLSDSTNSHRPGHTESEATVGPTFDKLFMSAEGRVIMSTFSSNIHRVYQAIQHGIKYGRKVAVIGRSMEKNLEISRELGYISIPQNVFIDAHEVAKYADKEVLIVTTGSQGETMSALYRMATDEHRHIKIKPTDTIILSAKAIPGNEASVSSVLNFLLKAGAKVAYQDFSEIHVSGHAAQEEQKLMLRLVKPKFFLPVHGEYNHLVKHKDTAMRCGIPEKNILLMEDGDQIEVAPTYIRKVRSVKTGKVFIDNQINKQIDNDVVLDRQKLATDGIVSIIAQVSPAQQKVIDKPRVTSFGIVGDRESRAFAKEMEEVLEHFLKNCKKEFLQSSRAAENEIRQVVRKHIFRKTKKYPMIVPTIFFV